MASKRGPKMKLLPMPPSNFIALGTSSSSAPSAQQLQKVAPKRVDPIEPTAVGASVPKKSKLSHHMTRSSGPIQQRRESGDHWEEFAQEVDSSQLLERVIDAEDVNDERVEALLCGAVRQLRLTRGKPDSALYLTLCYLAKTRPLLFITELVVEAFCSLLKRDATLSYKTKTSNLVPILSANILLAVYHDENNWPDQFLKVFIEDSLGERTWVDSEDCKGFVDNLLASFATKLPPKSMMQQDVLASNKLSEPSSVTSSPSHPTDDAMDETSCSSIPMTAEAKEHLENIAVNSRYLHNEAFVVEYVTGIINEQFNRRTASSDVSRNMLKLLVATVGIPSVRLIVAQKLEQWLQNPKLTRPAQDLLLTLCMNCNENDGEVISQLVKMRLKTKPLTNHFLLCMKEIMNQTDDSFRLLLRTILYNEVSAQRGLNNLQLIAIMFQHSSDRATKVVAEVFQEMIAQKEDYLKTLRGLLREIARALKHEHMNYLLFAQYLMEEGRPFLDLDQSEFQIRERAVTSITDLLTMIMLLSVSPAVKEAVTTAKPDRREIIRNHQMQVSNIQRLSVHWLQKTVIKSFRPERNEYLHCLNKVLFMETADHYYSRDGWPPENDRNLVFRMTSEVPLLEETLIRILSMGASKDNPLTSSEAIELSDALIKRAASIAEYDSLTFPVLMIKDKQIFSLLMSNAVYKYPDNISLPAGYEPPNMAIADAYWKVWIQLLILTAHNPSEFGTLGWEGYPTLSVLIEMSITNHFEFPPPTKKDDDLINRELQISAYEKQQILQFESYLAAASTKVQINESNSLLLSKLITMDPLGPARKPSSAVLEQFKQLNTFLRLGHLLCQSRNPDFLLEIIQRQQKQVGSSSSAPMPWLVELVESNENNFGMLPVQCLCEFLLGQINEEESSQPFSAFESSTKYEKSKRKEKRRKQMKLIGHLQTVISSQSTQSKELIEYFMKRLSFQQSSARTLASKALSLVLSTDVSAMSEDKPLIFTDVRVWLLERLPQIANFEYIRSSACDSLRPAILVETVPNSICHYIQFLSRYDQTGSSDLALDCAHILVDRQLITNCILQQEQLKQVFVGSLLNIFLAHLTVTRRPSREIFGWTNSQDHIMVQWKNDEAAYLNISVVHAMIILLTFEPTDNIRDIYNQLLETWFCDPQPQSFLVDTSEPALLIPDWLRLRLLKSSSPRLVEAALRDVEINQLILFIQSFGLSVTSMERLLKTLDSATEFNSEEVKENLKEVDESLIYRVVEVQWMRGVTSGHKFAKLLGNTTEETNVVEEEKMDTSESTDKSVVTEIEAKFSTFKTDLMNFLTNDKTNCGQYLLKVVREITQELFDKKIATKKLTKLFLNEFSDKFSHFVELINKGELNSIFNVIITFSTKDAKNYGLKNEITAAKNAVKQSSEVKNTTLINIFNRFTTVSPKSQQKSKTVDKPAKQKKSVEKSAEEIAKMILKSDNDSMYANKGLLLEMFHKMEPELVSENSANTRLETQLLFSRNNLHLLSLLIHKTRFQTLNSCIKNVLSEDQDLGLNSTAVLDFLTACLGSPRLWNGRDLNQPKHMEYEDVLKLNENQIRKLIGYVIEEGNAEKRVSLIIKSCCLNDSQIKVVVNTLKQVENSRPESSIASEMLFRLYLQIPSIEQPTKLVESDFTINSQKTSVADRVAHNLLTAFTAIETLPTRSQVTYLSDCELSLLKMASKHPILFLRQLPMIPALLKGKINSVTYEVFRTRNFLSTFKRILNILRLLKPYLWNKHVKGLNELLSAYIQLFATYCRSAGKEILPLLSQFLFLIDDWIKFDAESANAWIKANRKPIFDLSTLYPEQLLFKSILSGLPYQMQTSIDKQLSENILLRLRGSKSNAEQMSAVLNDLDKVSDSKPEILEYFVDDLRQLYFNAISRQMAFQLTIKLLKHNPSHSKSFVATYCQCLQRNDFYLANLALEYLPEFLILAQEHRTLILKKAFEIGIMGNTNVISNVCEAFSLINSQLGY